MTVCLVAFRSTIIVLLAFLAGAACTTLPFGSEQKNPRRTLKVVLYPYIPEHTEFFYDVERQFEEANPSIDLRIIDLTSDYYDSESQQSVTSTVADVYELDSVFLADFVKEQRLHPLPPSLRPRASQFLPVAEQASQVNGTWYGVPHWACTNFLFFRNEDGFDKAKGFADIEALIGKSHELRKGLLIDVKGKSTLGELYLDALIDKYGSIERAFPFLDKEKMDPGTEDILARALALCDPGYCRDSDYHYAKGFYARRFARQDGRALVGYSERLFYVGDERLNSCKKESGREKECLDPKTDIDFIELPLGDAGSHPFAWVDLLAIAQSCTGQCLNDATEFIAFVTGVEQVKRSLIPAWRSAPRYLLPAHLSLYNDSDILKEAPLYKRMLPSLQKAIPVTGYQLNKRLRDIGGQLDNRLPKP